MSALALSGRRVAKNSFSQIISFGFAGGSKAIAGILVARVLGPDGLGVFSLSWTLAGTLAYVAVLGLDNRLIRELARHGDKRELQESLPVAMVLGCGLALMLFALPYLFDARSEVVQALSAAAAYIAISAPVLMLRAAFHAKERMEMETATAVLEGVVGLGGAAAALALGSGVWGAMLGLTAGRAANLGLSLILYRRLWGPLQLDRNVTRWKPLMSEGWPLAVSYSLTASYLRFDIMALALFSPRDEVGFYGAAAMILMTTPLLAVAFNSSLYPVIARAAGPDDPELVSVFRNSARALIVVSLPMAAGLSVMAQPIARLLFGDGFVEAGHILTWMAWVLPFRFANHLFGVALAGSGSRKITVVSGVLVFNLVASVILVPLWGAAGAVAGLLTTEGLLTAVLLWGIHPLSVPLLKPLSEGAAISVLVAAVVTVVPGPAVVRLFAGALAGGAAIAALLGRDVLKERAGFDDHVLERREP